MSVCRSVCRSVYRSVCQSVCRSVCLSVCPWKKFLHEGNVLCISYFSSQLNSQMQDNSNISPCLLPPFLVSIPSWCVFPICLKSILQSPASCCQSCVLATTEHKYVQLLALLRRRVDCTLYHVIFNSSPNRKLNYHHVCT